MLKSMRASVVSFTLYFLWLSSAFTAWAQSDRGTITGTVTDSTGAVLVGLSLTAVDLATGLRTKATTGPSGTYTILLLSAGTYQVIAELAKFKAHVHENV